MVRPYTTNYYFNRTRDLSGYEHVSTDGLVMLDHLIGETLATAFCDCDNGLQLVRYGRGSESVVVHRRMSDIKVTLTIYR